jgi:hypothetical protein
LARLFHDQTELAEKKRNAGDASNLITNQVFSNIRKNPERQKKLAMDLLNSSGASPLLNSYGLELLECIQEFYDLVGFLITL